MQFELISDFRDYYDHWFAPRHVEGPSIIWERMTRTDMSKRSQFELMSKAFDTPLYGSVGDDAFHEYFDNKPEDLLVVYEDEFAHRGEGKILCTPQEAIANHPSKLFSVFVATTKEPLVKAVSLRLLQIGNRTWWLKYQGRGDWKSNYCEETKISLVQESFGFWDDEDYRSTLFRQYPIFAVDFVAWFEHDLLLAIDFNSAPGIKGTGLEDFLTGKQCADLIQTYLFANS